MIHNGSLEFKDKFQRMYGSSAIGSVKTITFVVTEDCNLRCCYCYERNKNHSKSMTKDIARQAIDMLLENRSPHYLDTDKADCAILEFIGGEPLLQIDLISHACDYFRLKAFSLGHKWLLSHMISISTNGILYNDGKVQSFLRRNAQRISLGITIDGNEELHDACRKFPDGSGSFANVLPNVLAAIRNQGLDRTKVTISPENLPHLAESVKYLAGIGLTSIFANVVFEDVWKSCHATQLYEQLTDLADWLIEERRYQRYSTTLFDQSIGQTIDVAVDDRNWCGGDGSMIAIGTDGNLYPCIRYMSYSLSCQPELKIGDVRNGVDSKSDNPMLAKVCSLTRSSQSSKECMDCPVARGCAWCSGYNYDVFGTPGKRATFICGMHKARVLANHYYWSRVFKLENMADSFMLNLDPEDIRIITQGGTQ
jgi:uncharacterized protein